MEAEGQNGRRASSAADFFSRRPSSSWLQSMRRYSASTVFGLAREEGGQEGGGGRRCSAAQPSLPPVVREGREGRREGYREGRQERWRSLARAVLGQVEEGGEGQAGSHTAGKKGQGLLILALVAAKRNLIYGGAYLL